jgi:3-phenylpropionate/trans-cinnamate dioxygenase ferredoxin reductase component
VDTSALLVVGSGPAGIGAAEAFRERNRDGAVRVLSVDPHPPYERPPLSKDYLRGSDDDADVALHPPDWYDERGIELINDQGVDAIDVVSQTVTSGGSQYSYDALVLACGSTPTSLPVPGGESVLQLRSLSDASRLRAAAARATSAVVIGAGFIGCEAAASLALRGLSVTLLAPDKVPQAKRLGEEAGSRILGFLHDVGVRYLGGVNVESVADGAVLLDDGASVTGDLVVAATGIEPRSELARAVGLTLSDSRIVVRSDMRTSTKHVYAVGDVALAFNSGAGRPLAVEHWQDAADQGQIAGTNAAGGNAKWSGVPGFWTTIGETTLKYHAWGDGYQQSHFVAHDDGFTVWYETRGAAVGVLTCNADDDYEKAEHLITTAMPSPGTMS